MQIEYSIPQNIIDFYSQYRNQSQSVKKYQFQEHNFFLESNYLPVDISREFQYSYNYSIIVGNGAYGCVVQAMDTQTNQAVAIKKIEKAFEHRLYAKRTLRELKILRLIKHENIVDLKSIMLPPSREEMDDVQRKYFIKSYYRYMITELLEADMSQVINSDQPLTQEHLQLFIYQILRGLKYLHTSNILHRDLNLLFNQKPRNLLLNSNCDVKICDFGLGRAMIDPNSQNNLNMMTYYVETRWYRAPELLVSFKNYTPAVDIWSVGCILAEMILRRPFLRGESTKKQIKLIFELFGTPDEEYITQFQDEKVQKNLRKVISETGKRSGIPLENFFKNASKEAIDLLRGLLTFDYRKRLTVQQALKHPFLSILHSEVDEPSGIPVNQLEFEFEKFEMTREQIKDLIYEEILLYHYPNFNQEYEQKKQMGQSLISHVVNNENSKIVQIQFNKLQYQIDPTADDDLEHF